MKIITISREYCAGGHSIGSLTAEKLGVELYDKDIIKAASKEIGIDYKDVESEGETISFTDTLLRSIAPIAYDYKDSIFTVQKKVILDLAQKGSCVIIGRSADFILKEAGFDTLNVFLHASDVFRAINAARLLKTNNPETIQKTISRTDHQRNAWYAHYTGRRFGDYKNYDLVLDSGTLGFETCAELICLAAKSQT